MSDETNVSESVDEQPVSEPGEVAAEEPVSEEARKAEIKKNMSANYRRKAQAKDDFTFGNVRQNTKITETKREAQERIAAESKPEPAPDAE